MVMRRSSCRRAGPPAAGVRAPPAGCGLKWALWRSRNAAPKRSRRTARSARSTGWNGAAGAGPAPGAGPGSGAKAGSQQLLAEQPFELPARDAHQPGDVIGGQGLGQVGRHQRQGLAQLGLETAPLCACSRRTGCSRQLSMPCGPSAGHGPWLICGHPGPSAATARPRPRQAGTPAAGGRPPSHQRSVQITSGRRRARGVQQVVPRGLARWRPASRPPRRAGIQPATPQPRVDCSCSHSRPPPPRCRFHARSAPTRCPGPAGRGLLAGQAITGTGPAGSSRPAARQAGRPSSPHHSSCQGCTLGPPLLEALQQGRGQPGARPGRRAGGPRAGTKGAGSHLIVSAGRAGSPGAAARFVHPQRRAGDSFRGSWVSAHQAQPQRGRHQQQQGHHQVGQPQRQHPAPSASRGCPRAAARRWSRPRWDDGVLSSPSWKASTAVWRLTPPNRTAAP